MRLLVYLNSGISAELENVTQMEVNELLLAMSEKSKDRRVQIGEWVFNGALINAIKFLVDEIKTGFELEKVDETLFRVNFVAEIKKQEDEK